MLGWNAGSREATSDIPSKPHQAQAVDRRREEMAEEESNSGRASLALQNARIRRDRSASCSARQPAGSIMAQPEKG